MIFFPKMGCKYTISFFIVVFYQYIVVKWYRRCRYQKTLEKFLFLGQFWARLTIFEEAFPDIGSGGQKSLAPPVTPLGRGRSPPPSCTQALRGYNVSSFIETASNLDSDVSQPLFHKNVRKQPLRGRFRQISFWKFSIAPRGEFNGGIGGMPPNIGLTLVNLSPNIFAVGENKILGTKRPKFGGVWGAKWGSKAPFKKILAIFFKKFISQNVVLSQILKKIASGGILFIFFIYVVVVTFYKAFFY